LATFEQEDTMKSSRAFIVLVLIVVSGAAVFLWITKQSRGQAGGEQKSDDVISAYKQIEKAFRTGDGQLYLSLQSEEKRKAFKPPQENWLPANPSIQYAVLAVRRQGDRAAVLGKITDAQTPPQFYLVKYAKENGGWKIADDLIDPSPMDPSVLYAAVPPEDGAFVRAGAPWNTLPSSQINPKYPAAQILWAFRAVRDESFLYVRFETKMPLPTPGAEIPAANANSPNSIPQPPDSMVIKTGGGQQFGLQIADNPITRATFGDDGRATSNRFFMQYSFSLRNAAHDDLFSDGTGNSIAPLIRVDPQSITLKIPLQCLAIRSSDIPIEISEANSFAKLLPYQVSKFAR
jgi:hypothetical protein